MMVDGWREIEMRRLLRPSQRWTAIMPTGRYRQVTVRLWGKGVVPRGEVSGSEIAATQQRQVQAGQFVISKIDARNGAFGLVPAELDGAVVSNDFPVFYIDEDVVAPRFIEWLSKTAKFVDLCRRASEGSTNRVRLTEDRFLNLTVAIPDLPEQRRIVVRLDQVERLTKDRQATIETMETEAEAMLRAAFDRIADGAPLSPMSDVAPLVRRPVEIDPDDFYTEIGVRSFYKGIFHRRRVSGADFSWQKLFRIENGDLVFSNLMAWEQAIAEAFNCDHGCVGNHRMLTCRPTPNVMVSGFLSFFFRTRAGFAEIMKASPGTAARNKTLSPMLLAAIQVPTPPFDQQLWFDRLQGKVREMQSVRQRASETAGALLPAMLHEIFGEVEM